MKKFIFILFLSPLFSAAQFPLPSNVGFNKPHGVPFAFLLDDFTGAERGYSVRKLRSAYNGFCMRVRRSSDNTEQDIGFVSNILDVASLTAFVGANSGYVTIWYDQSINLIDATQVTTASQPRIVNAGTVETQNSLPTVFFDGVDDFMSYSGMTVSDGIDWSAFTVSKKFVLGGVGVFFGSGTSIGSTSLFSSTDDRVYSFYMTAGTPRRRDAADGTANFSLIGTFRVSSTLSGYKNGTAYSFGSETDLGFAGSNLLATLCRFGSSFGHGYFSEAVFYLNDQTGTRTGIEANINGYFSLF